MSLKSLLTAGLAVCVLSSSAMAAPSILAQPLPYNPAAGGVQWDIFVTQHDPAYTGALSIEIPLTLTQVAGNPGSPAIAFTQFLNGDGGDKTNGGVTNTWYYNETAPASAILLWNITDGPANPANEVQNVGTNPFCPGGPGCPAGSQTEGLYIDSAGKRVFAALGSTVGMADALPNPGVLNPEAAGKQVRVLRIVTSDGVLNWNNAIIGENGVQYTGISGSAQSRTAGDVAGNSDMLQAGANAGNFTDPVNNGDVADFRTLLIPVTGITTYQSAHPGLNGNYRGDYNNDGRTNNGDVAGFRASLASPSSGAGSGLGGGSSVPEPTSVVLVLIGALAAGAVRRPRS